MPYVLHEAIFNYFNDLLFPFHLCIAPNDCPKEVSEVLIEQLSVSDGVLNMKNAFNRALIEYFLIGPID
jgi:hypothetical protein